MTNVLVCIKRVPDTAGDVLLTADEQAVDARYVGFTVSAHENCAVELAVRIATAGGGTATVLTVGPEEAVEQLRSALGVGCSAAVLVEADPTGFGPADVAREIAAVVEAHAAEGRTYDLVLLGNDADDTGDFQVGIRLAYALGRPVVNGVRTVEVSQESGPQEEGTASVATAQAAGPDGVETYAVPLPAVVTVLEGGVEPRYPTITGRMKAKKAKIEIMAPHEEPRGSGRVRLTLPPAQPSSVEVLGEGPDAAKAVVDLLERLGVAR
jgi:electron transfer flavoprotein beta subunit